MTVYQSSRYNRRRFLVHTAAAVSATAWVQPPAGAADSPNERVNIAAVGVGGKGWTDVNGAAKGHNVVAFCDVEQGNIKRKGGYGAAAEQWPKAKRYTDWREMLDKEYKHIDGITVSTPDHMHAPVTMTALKLGIASYTQKPLTRTIHEARQLTIAAREAEVATQMGNQHHNGLGYRTLVQLIQGGAIGKIKEAHSWSNRPIWPQGLDRPKGKTPVPSKFAWDMWLGGAPDRPHVSGAYHPFKWRGWYDFGAGALGDMGCHIIDPVVWALELGPPNSVSYEGPKPKPETFPEWEVLRYDFNGSKHTTDAKIQVVWYDGGKLPPTTNAHLPKGKSLPTNGTLFVGEKGSIVTRHGGMPDLYPQENFRDYDIPKLEKIDHYQQWTDAIRGKGEPTSDFDYAGPLTETVLLGVVASHFPDETLKWDSKNLKFTNDHKANNFVQQPYRKGWEVEGL